MARDINFTKISKRDLAERQETVNGIIENKDAGIIDKNVGRKDIVNVYDKVFFNHVMLALENNSKVNSCFFNDFSDRTNSNFSKSYNVQLDPLNTCLKLSDKGYYGEYFTREIFSNDKPNSTMNNFFLIVDQDIPRSSTVKYYLITDKDEVFPIEANGKTALEIKDKNSLPKKVKIQAVINQSPGEIKLKIKGISLLYSDSYISSKVDIFGPDFDREIVETPDDFITLYRDPKNEDRLYKVESSTDRTLINYNMNGELTSLDTIDVKNNKKKSDVTMIYEDYTNSSGTVERVLSRIKTRNSLPSDSQGDKIHEM